MTKTRVIERIRAVGIVPVVRAPTVDDALRVCDAIRSGGIDVIELTMTVPDPVRLIEDLAKRWGDQVVLGAGTVLDSETARACILAGAAFVVSPALDEATITCCRTYGIPVLPGALTPTEIVRASRAGADFVKVFPCGAMGGASYIKALKAPLPHIDLIPTGGVSLANLADYIRAGVSAVGAGAELVDIAKVRSGNASAVTETARKYVEIIKQTRAEQEKA
jgi:2-dehydro-3-deoxyphosphogluconate aldolase/(4S)-4-hydroxy-2-oxoglutarate aldolase